MTDFPRFSRRSFLVMPLALAACSVGRETIRVSGPTMGTAFNLVAFDPTGRLDKREVLASTNATLTRVNRQMSNWDANSEISRFNAHESTDQVPVSAALAEVMNAAEAVHTASGGRFDTTIGPLIELWGFGAPGGSARPSEARIADARMLSGHANALIIGPNTLRKVQPQAQIYLAAIGKGYAADQVGRTLEAFGVRDYMVEIGGDLYASGLNPDGMPWQIGIENPVEHRREAIEVVAVSDLGLASSGDYRNFFRQDGQRFSHIVDPGTGRPVTHDTASATVIAENAMLADAWATAMHTLGRTAGLTLAEELGIAVKFIERSRTNGSTALKTTTSTRFKALTTLG